MSHNSDGSSAGPRLRAACNECHACKVKCSGEKTGCARCLTPGAECKFEVSMVGKCSKGRRRKRNSNGSQDRRTTALPTPSASSVELPDRGDDDVITNDFDGLNDDSINSPQFLGAWATMGSYNVMGMPSLTDETGSVGNDMAIDNAPNFDDLNAYFNFTPGDCAALNDSSAMDLPASARNDGASGPSILSTTSANTLSSTTSVGAEQSPNASKTRDVDDGSNDPLQALRICFDNIILLETQLLEDKRPVDELMHAGKTCAKQLRTVIQLDSYQRCAACPKLMLAAVDLIMMLYENITPRLAPTGDSSTLMGNGQKVPSDSSSGFRLGNFQADPEDAADVWRRLVLGELRRMSKLVDAMAARRQEMHRRQLNSRTLASYRSLLESLQQRIVALTNMLQPEHF